MSAARAITRTALRRTTHLHLPLATTTTTFQTRLSSHIAPSTTTPTPRKPVTLPSLLALHARQTPITMLTAHDYPTALVASRAQIDVVLVGDSLAMVALGHPDTSSITLDEMIHHCRAVVRGAGGSSFVVGDLPMGSYEVSSEQAVASAVRMVKEGGVQGVKLEGGEEMAGRVRAIVRAGIAVLAHVGLTPQRQNMLGGFRVQGKKAEGAMRVLRDARAVQNAGAWGLVLEAVPAEVATVVSRELRVPTIGIGAGAGCGGQVLVQGDMLSDFPPGRGVPRFVKPFGDVWSEAAKGIERYRDEVKDRSFPAKEHTYPMAKEEFAEFERLVEEEKSRS